MCQMYFQCLLTCQDSILPSAVLCQSLNGIPVNFHTAALCVHYSLPPQNHTVSALAATRFPDLNFIFFIQCPDILSRKPPCRFAPCRQRHIYIICKAVFWYFLKYQVIGKFAGSQNPIIHPSYLFYL